MLDPSPSLLSRRAKLKEPSKAAEEQTLIGETDMPHLMQSHALRVASEALDSHNVTDCKEIACYIKKQFDKTYGAGWQCVTGVGFGSYITHSSGSFIHFCIGRLAVMLFKAAT
ncbi:uncharacterized protein [Physcomitrium patens]|uniref:Dynein light chain n=1 Tax=Physcomitrium patens TaxID=3218 RepID=A9RFJ7_PHYPA|nr:dynein light chain LC6, flagellar outer arm-like [Physcomitrium patens]XP_024367022.1 dynein light chain LC6, flagellar outer arm-like [Physcomitrium patens]XP_024367023.1 dynein light chain LC6, flagellar outer arm-like [Physcomitrium patens]XP_024367024.1 dynein light chain LC6, flagellar outer arm-like [Physcomitrium patens]XP_024367026.1 dynein light chain LC6, flagellar outer arm-like [Physcomitrium patens]PNR27058.1 hypothetical protein PHYPA_030539 [Physcomitrium patens]|eukprot:XP_024367021.1 dynein light chain LC6, flagellar outer arm-like [Physcomitrella patens]